MDASVLVGLFATLTMLSLRDPELHVWRDAAKPGALIMLDAVIDWTKRKRLPPNLTRHASVSRSAKQPFRGRNV